MAVIKSWAGNGLGTGNVTTSTAGTGDNAFDAVPASPVATVVATGTRSPQIQVQNTGSGAYLYWDITAQTVGAGRCYFTTPAAWSSAAAPICGVVFNSATLSMNVAISGTGAPGQLRLYNGGSQLQATANSTLSNSTTYRIEWTISHGGGTGTATVKCYLGDSLTEVASLTQGSTNYQTSHNRVFFGFINNSPNVGASQLDDMAAGDAASLIGPAVTTAAASGTGSLTLTGSGAISAVGSSVAAVTMTGAGSARAAAAGTAALTLTGTATGAAPGTGAASLALTGTAAASTAATGTAALTLTGTAATAATAAGTGALTLTGDGTAVGHTGVTGTAALTLTGTGAATAPTTGAAVLDLTAVAADLLISADSVALLELAALATADAVAEAGGAAVLDLTGTADARGRDHDRDLTVTARLLGSPWRADQRPPAWAVLEVEAPVLADSLEYAAWQITADHDITDDTVEASFDQGGTWHPLEDAGSGVWRILLGPGGVELPVGSPAVRIRVTDAPEIPILDAGRLRIHA